MESWRRVLREGFLPQLSIAQLEQLREAVVADDPRLIQGATTQPPPLMCVQNWPVECGCLLSYVAALENGGFMKHRDGSDNPNAAIVADVEEAFARLCHDVDLAIGEPAGVRWLLNWYDESPRYEVLRELAFEFDLELLKRQGAVALPAAPGEPLVPACVGEPAF